MICAHGAEGGPLQVPGRPLCRVVWWLRPAMQAWAGRVLVAGVLTSVEFLALLQVASYKEASSEEEEEDFESSDDEDEDEKPRRRGRAAAGGGGRAAQRGRQQRGGKRKVGEGALVAPRGLICRGMSGKGHGRAVMGGALLVVGRPRAAA